MKIFVNENLVFEYIEKTGLITKNGDVVGSNLYEPAYTHDASGKPLFCGIIDIAKNKFISLSGNYSKLV